VPGGAGWTYHGIVRIQMLRHKRRQTPQGWVKLHEQLADHFEQGTDDTPLPEGVRDESWREATLHALYHRLCARPRDYLDQALNGFLQSLRERQSFALEWVETMEQAGRDAENSKLTQWNETLAAGRLGYEEDKYDDMVSMLTRLLAYDGIEENQLAVILAWRGEAYRLMKQYENAIADFDRAVELDTDYAWAVANRGHTYRLLERYEEALADFDRAIELNPEYNWAIIGRGFTHQDMKRYKEALVDFNQVIELDADNAKAIAERGFTYWLLEQYEEALTDFSRAIELDANYTRAVTNRGSTYQMLGRYEEALADFDRAIELDADYIWAITERGYTYRERVNKVPLTRQKREGGGRIVTIFSPLHNLPNHHEQYT
jgi:tetratricopeptide (TPR) repeat protein